MTPSPSPPHPQSFYLSPTIQRGIQRRDSEASSVHSIVSEHSELDTDSEDDSMINAARTSAEIRAHDRNILFEEEERDRILTEKRQGSGRSLQRRGSGHNLPNPFKEVQKMAGKIKGQYASIAQGSPESFGEARSIQDAERERREGRRQRRANKRESLLRASGDGEDRGLLYEMEEGSIKSGSETGSSSDSEGLEDTEKEHLHHNGNGHTKTRWSWKRWLYIAVLILLFLALVVLGAWKLSTGFREKRRDPPPLLSNGTSLFLPTTIYISLDGFRADYIDRGATPNLLRFISQGVAPPYMNPSFPSVTFPNHYTLATGLYPESHGIVANKFWDAQLNKTFYYTDTPNSMAKEWWSEAEPIWITAERNDVKTAVHMWPGSEALIFDTDISYLDKYESKYNLSHKVDRVLGLLDMTGPDVGWNETLLDRGDRPQLIMSYIPNVDSIGHKFGPQSSQINETIKVVDDMLGHLFTGLQQRNLADVINVVIVSDHGMAESSNDRLVEIEEIIDMRLVEHVDGWPLYGLRPHSSKRLEEQRQDLNQLESNLSLALKNPKYKDAYQVYFKEEIPERFNWRHNDRIAPLWIIPSTGWAIVTKEEFDVEAAKTSGIQYHPKGIHGYDHEDPLMRSIFAASGPAFNVDGSESGSGSKIKPFQNIEVYNLICDSIGLDPLPNNGTLRLPLRKDIVLMEEAKAVVSPSTPTSSTHLSSTHLSSAQISSTAISSSVSSAISSLSSALSSVSTEASSASPLKKPPVTISSTAHSYITLSTPSSLSAKKVTSSSSENAVPTPKVPIPSPSTLLTSNTEDGDFEQGNEGQEEEEGGREGLGGLWDWVKGAVGDAVDFVGGVLPGN